MRRKTILFITHEVSNTGAPILLLNLLKEVKRQDEYNILILAVRDGDIFGKFQEVAPTGYLKPADYRKEKSPVKKQLNKLTFALRLATHVPMWRKADIVFNNTIGNGKILKYYMRFKKLPVISYIHELASAIEVAERYGEATLTFNLSSLILSPSNFNKKILVNNYRVPDEKVKLLPYLIPSDLKDPDNIAQLKQKCKTELCASLNIAPDTRLVLGMGTFDKRKATDLFIKTAEQLKRTKTFFVWIGISKEADFFKEMMGYVAENKVTNFLYAGSKPHDLANYLPYDLLFLSSREDPYPLVVLEAAMTGVSTVCFKGSGGIIDFVTPECGWIVDEFSTNDAAKQIARIKDIELIEKGKKAQEKVNTMHLDGGHIYSIFKRYISGLL